MTMILMLISSWMYNKFSAMYMLTVSGSYTCTLREMSQCVGHDIHVFSTQR